MGVTQLTHKATHTHRLCNFTEKLIEKEVIKVSVYTPEISWKHKPPLRNKGTFHHHLSQVQACPSYCWVTTTKQTLSINSEVKKEHLLFHEQTLKRFQRCK